MPLRFSIILIPLFLISFLIFITSPNINSTRSIGAHIDRVLLMPFQSLISKDGLELLFLMIGLLYLSFKVEPFMTTLTFIVNLIILPFQLHITQHILFFIIELFCKTFGININELKEHTFTRHNMTFLFVFLKLLLNGIQQSILRKE